MHLIENDSLYEEYSREIYYMVQSIVKEVVERKFRTLFKKHNVNEVFIIEETSHEILLKLLERKYRPSEIYQSFWNFIYICGRNWITRFVSREIVSKINLQFNEDDVSSAESPEEQFITGEEKKIIARAFIKLFNDHLNELWLSHPIYSIVVQFWIKRKKEISENILEVFRTASLDEDFNLDFSFEDDCSGDEIPLYEMILDDVMEFRGKMQLSEPRFVQISKEKKEEFLLAIQQVEINSKSLNRIKQWLHRGITIIRIKMLRDLEDF